MAKRPATIDEYLATVEAPVRAALSQLRTAIRAAIPGAEECISYGMPAFRVPGGVVAGFAARKGGGSYYPFSGSTLAALRGDLDGRGGTKSALHFTAEEPLPPSLVRKLVRARLGEIEGRARPRRTPRVTARGGRGRA